MVFVELEAELAILGSIGFRILDFDLYQDPGCTNDSSGVFANCFETLIARNIFHS